MEKSIKFLENHIKELLKDNFFKIAVLGTLMEYILFILLLSDVNAVSINFRTAFLGVPSLLIYSSFVLMPYSFGFLFKGRGQKLFLILINIMLSLLIVFDLWYYRSNSSFLNYYMLGMTGNLEGLSSSIIAMIRPIDLVFFIPSLVLISLFFKNNKVYKECRLDLNKFSLLFIIPLLYLGYSHIKIDKLQKGYAYQYAFRVTWSKNQMMYNLTPLGYHLFDLYNYIEDNKPYVLSDEEKNKITNYYNSKEKNLPKNNYSGMFKGKNLIVIQVESLENFVIKEKVNGQEITPNLNKLLNNSFYFSNYHEQTYNGTTSDGTFVSNTSMFPTLVGNNNFNFPYNDYNSLPKLLKAEGYSTYSMHGEKGTYWNWITAEKHMGFDTCLDIGKFNVDETSALGLMDKSFLSQAVEKIEAQQKPFYTFMITLTSHSPFSLPKEEIKISLPNNLKNTKTGGFIESIHYTDAAIGKFIESLDEKGLLEDTVIAIYGDHEGIHKFFNEEVQSLRDLPEAWRDNDRRVPLIIYSKGLQGEEFKVNGGQVDFLPTICYLMDIDENKYINTSLGRNLLNTNLDYTILTNRSYRGPKISKDKEKEYIDILEISNIMIKTNYFKER